MPIVGVPKTIDNDIVGTTNCFGFDTAVAFATDAIDRLHTTAEAHKRILVVEVMGRYAGWIALYAGVAGGADAILIPEIPFDLAIVAQRLRERDRLGREVQHRRRRGRGVSEGRHAVAARGGARRPRRAARRHRRAGLRGARTARPARKRDRSCSATCSAAARRPASTACSRRGSAARRSNSCSSGEFGTMVAFAPPDIIARRIDDVVGKTKTVPIGFRSAGDRKGALGSPSATEQLTMYSGRSYKVRGARFVNCQFHYCQLITSRVLERAAGVEQHDRFVRLDRAVVDQPLDRRRARRRLRARR